MGRYGAYPAYKASGVAWLREIPAHWTVKRLKDIASHNDEALPETTDPDFEMEYVEISDVALVDGITGSENVTFDKAPSRARRRVRHGDTIISTVRTYLKAIAAIKNPPENMIVSTGFAVIRPRANQYPDFVGYLLQNEGFVGDVVAFSTGVSYPAINASILASLPVVEPPLPEQQAIARFLDHKTAQIDALIARKEALLARLADKRTALISQAVTKGLDPAAPMKNSGIDWLGEIPAHWETRQLKHLVRPDTSITYGIVQAGPNVEDGVPYIRTGDMAGEYLPTEGYLRTSHEIDRQYHRSRVSTGDIVVAIRATVGKCLPVPPYLDGANLTQGTAKVSPGNDLDRNYLLWVMRSGNIQQRFDAVSKGSTFREITLDMLRRLVVPVPPLVEQQAIAEVAQRETEQTYTLASRVTKAIDKLKQYRTALITHAVTGKIDVRGVVIPAVGSEMTFG